MPRRFAPRNDRGKRCVAFDGRADRGVRPYERVQEVRVFTGRAVGDAGPYGVRVFIGRRGRGGRVRENALRRRVKFVQIYDFFR